MDSDNQINSSISRDAIVDVPIEFSSGHGPEKYEIELLDFELVLTYSASRPDVHLEVSRCRIEWEKGPQKFLPSRKLRKSKHVGSLLDRAGQKAKDCHWAFESNGATSLEPNSSGSDIAHDHRPSQLQGSPLDAGRSQQFFSQIPVKESAALERPSKAGYVHSHDPAELLQRLEPTGRTTPSDAPQQDSPAHTQAKTSASDQPPQITSNEVRSPSIDSRMPLPRTVVATNGSEKDSMSSQERSIDIPLKNQRSRSGAAFPQLCEVDKPSGAVQANAHVGTLSSQIPFKETEHAAPDGDQGSLAIVEPNDHTNRPSRKRQRESVESQPHVSEDGGESAHTGSPPSKKRPRADLFPEVCTEPAATDKKDKDEAQPSHGECPKPSENQGTEPMAGRKRENPWRGLSMITDDEINIPPAQAELLIDKLCWIPPVPGDPEPQGHVPPPLLKQWNIIAQRRHQEQTAEVSKSPSPTQDINMSSASSSSSSEEDDGDDEEDVEEDVEEDPFDWSQSPDRTRSRNALPPSSSPVKQPAEIQRQAARSGGENQISHVNREDDTTKSCRNTTTPDPAAEAPKPSQGIRPGAGPVADTATVRNVRPSQDAVSEQGHHDMDMSIQGDSTTTGSREPRGKRADSNPASPNYDDDPADDSDESVMDTSVPFALGESYPEITQSTQGEQALTSTCPSLHADPAGHVQVAVTPVIRNSHRRGRKGNDGQSESEPTHSTSTSSQAHKLSSQSRVMSTYPHHSSSEKSQSSHEGAKPSSLQSENRSPRVDVAGTQIQSNSSHELSQAATQSQEIVLESSRPAQRHQFISLSDTNLSLDEPENFQWASAISCLQTAVTDQEQTDQRSKSRSGDNESSQERLRCQSVDSAAGMGRISNRDKLALAVEVYLTFRTDYSDYTGNFNHFTELCAKLRGVRTQGYLQRSFLWDDFIIMHLLKYPLHINERGSQGSGILSYEDYFRLNFTHPLHKKRSLTICGIDHAASQFSPTEEALTVTNIEVQIQPPVTQDETSQSTTASQNQASDARAHSSNEAPRSSLPAPKSPAMSNSQATSTPIKQEGGAIDSQEFANITQYPMNADNVKDEEPTHSSPESNIDQITRKTIYNTISQNDGDISMDEIEETDIEYESHETASPELGDDSFTSNMRASSRKDTAELDPVSEIEDDDENWFAALSRMRPTRPVWSDDPEAPFKEWVEHHENVKSERLRRGGTKALFDEKGVIQRSRVSVDENEVKPSVIIGRISKSKSSGLSVKRRR